MELPYLAIHLEENRSWIPMSLHQGWPYCLTVCELHVLEHSDVKGVGQCTCVEIQIPDEVSLKMLKKKKNLTINLGNIYITLGKGNQVKQEIWNLKEKII